MDIFKFPFLADIWGTVSDWVMIAVTTLTAYFLYKTLKSQQEVQKAQNRLLEIEQLRLREEYKPELAYSRYYDEKVHNPLNEHLISIAIRNITNNPAINVRVDYPDDKNVHGSAVTVNNLLNFIKGQEYISLHVFIKSLAKNILAHGFDFTVMYQDIAGTKYKQLVLCRFLTKDDVEFLPHKVQIMN